MKTILLIEDDADVRDNTAEILELAHYRVLKAQNGKQGVDLARKELPDLVLCDIMMPELDGYGVLHMLGRSPETAEIPFIFLTAKAERSDVRRGMELGADDYLTKPFEESELLNAIEGRLKRSDLFRKGFDRTLNGLNDFMEQARGVSALEDLSKDRKTREYGRKDVLFHEGDELRQIPFLVAGKVRTFKVNNEGKEFVTGLHVPGDFIGYLGLLEGGHATETAEALEETEVALVPREDLLRLLYRDRDVSMRFIRMLSQEMGEKQERLLQLAYASVRQRVAQALLQLHDRFSADHSEDLGVRISRDDLAAIVGTATESLIRCLTDLKDEGLISTQGRDIRITDHRRLQKLANL
ncbi:MAG TPA: response regulator [Flavobacteriales bacterium]|nr:response regulator [Flavobacteriales bacterium]HRO40414.1 response regulator [Flavobacteriales bacterium]HRP80745.1 response regulator [Flavobacteriales bacterium]HRQ84321.1 response regulator [Flavobacteriales bacterium]